MPTWERKFRVIWGWWNNLWLGRDLVNLETVQNPRYVFEEFAARPRPAAPAAPAADPAPAAKAEPAVKKTAEKSAPASAEAAAKPVAKKPAAKKAPAKKAAEPVEAAAK
jgi:NADH dehydrogenase